MIEENVQEQEEFPESKPAEKERFTDRLLTREVTMKGINFQMYIFFLQPAFLYWHF